MIYTTYDDDESGLYKLFYGAKLQILNDIHNMSDLSYLPKVLFYGAKLQILNDIHNAMRFFSVCGGAVLWCKVTNFE